MKNVPEIERQGRHARQLVRGLHRGDGAGQSASGAEGGGADEPDGRRLDGRRLVPLRRVPPDRTSTTSPARPPRAARASDDRATGYDDYENFRRAGSAGDFAQAAGLDQLPCWRKIAEHPAYDAFWQRQALDKTMAAQPLNVPTMWIQGLWDQEDMWGAIHCYLAVEPKDTRNDMNFLVMGPWRHSGVNYDGSSLGPLKLDGDTALAVPARRAEAVLRSVSEGRRAEGRHAAGVHLQHRRESLGSAAVVAARVRRRLRDEVDAALSDEPASACRSTAPAGAPTTTAATTSTSPIRPSRCRTAAPGPLRRRRRAGARGCVTRSAVRRRSPRRAHLSRRRC